MELTVDDFAGGGGASLGIEAGIGRSVDIAINHDREAIAMHEANHPHTRHLHEDVWKVDPLRVTDYQPVGFGWFSPDCKHFSKAKGGQPVDRKIRALAWVAVRWAKLTNMRIFILENVEEFADWGPVLEDGTPCPLRKGLTFRRWFSQLENLGYNLEMRQVRACEYGAPTTRRRLFIVGRSDGLPIEWPTATHGAGRSVAGAKSRFRSKMDGHRCRSCLRHRRTLPHHHRYGPVNAIGSNTKGQVRRIARGIMRYVVNNPRPFIVPLTHHPARTAANLHSRRQHWFQVGYGEREGQAPRILDLQKPLGTVVAQGNKHALVAAFLARHYGGHENDGAPLQQPMFTVTAQDHHALVSSHLVKFKGTCRDGQRVDEPLHTVQAGGFHYGEVRAFLLKYYGNEREGHNPQLPLGTVTTKDRFGLVTVRGEEYAIVDIGMRMLTPRELFRAQGFPENYIIDPQLPDKRTGKLKPLTKTAQVRMCGNSVCPDVARALVAANYSDRSLEVAA